MHVDDLVDTGEMYLKAVLELEEEGVIALRARLADRFEHAGPTVSQTVGRLQRDGLVELDADRHLALTQLGRRTAAGVMRKHRLAEVFLERMVGLDWELLHEEACRWEHVMSDRVEMLLDELLGHPDRTPYGNAVHTSEGELSRRDGVSGQQSNLVRLAAAAEGKIRATILWIGEPLQADPDALRMLRRHGLLPGVEVSFVLHGPSLLVSTDAEAEPIELPHGLAVHLFAATEARLPTGAIDLVSRGTSLSTRAGARTAAGES